MRPDLQEDVAADFEEPVDGAGEADRVPHVVPPVVGVEDVTRDRLSRHRRDERHDRRSRPQRGERIKELMPYRIHQRTVVRDTSAKHTTMDRSLLARLDEAL